MAPQISLVLGVLIMDVSGAYQLSYTGDITQLFVDDEPMVNARWPNAQFNDDSIFSHSTWAEGDEG